MTAELGVGLIFPPRFPHPGSSVAASTSWEPVWCGKTNESPDTMARARGRTGAMLTFVLVFILLIALLIFVFLVAIRVHFLAVFALFQSLEMLSFCLFVLF